MAVEKKIVLKGTSNFVLIPSVFLKQLDLETNDKVSLYIENDKIIISKTKERK